MKTMMKALIVTLKVAFIVVSFLTAFTLGFIELSL